MKAHLSKPDTAKPAIDKSAFAKGFVYRGIEIKPYYITRLAETREAYEAMKNAAAVAESDAG